MRGLLFGLVLVALASAASCLAEPQDQLLEVSSLARLHQRVNVHLGAGRKAGSHAPPLTPEAPVHGTHDDDDHSGSPSASLKPSTSSITLKEPIDIDTKGPQSTYSVIENASPHIHNNINNIVKNHNRNIAAEKRRLLTVGDLGEAEIQAVHSVLDKLFPEEANLEREAKEFELSQLQPIPPAKVAKLPKAPKAPKAEKETKKRHEFSEGSVAYLKKIWQDNKSVAKLRTYYTNRVASAIDQLQQSKDLLFKPELKPTLRKRAATEAFLAFELRHRARLVTRWAQDVSDDKCQIKLVAGARKRDLRTYGSRDGPTFELLVNRKIKSMQKACKKQSKKLKNKNKKEKNKNKNEKKEHKEEQPGSFDDEDFVKLYNSIVSSARRPNRFLNLFLRIKKAKKTEKKPAEHDVDEGLDGKPKLDPASSEPIDAYADHADACTLVEKQGMMELQQMMDSVELELIEDPEEHEVCAFTPAKKHDL